MTKLLDEVFLQEKCENIKIN